jgi:hypothetical protein
MTIVSAGDHADHVYRTALVGPRSISAVASLVFTLLEGSSGK